MPGRVTSIEVAPPNRMGEARNHRTENALDRLALVEIGIPFLLVRQRRRLAESGKRDLTVAILDQVAPMLLGPEACLTRLHLLGPIFAIFAGLFAGKPLYPMTRTVWNLL